MSPPKSKKLTVKSVAEQLGVSTATISNAFNRPDQLSEAKRTEILEACKRIGYRGPNRAAQILRKGQSNIIALVLSDSAEYTVSDPVGSDLTKGICMALDRADKHCLMFGGGASTILDIADFVDGFICYGVPENAAIAEELKTVDKPVVTVDFKIDGRPSVFVDNEFAAYELAKSVLKPDDRVAILGLKLMNSPVTSRVYDSELLECEYSISNSRLNGYIRAMQELGVEVRKDLIWNIPFNVQRYSSQAANELLSSQPRPNTVFYMSDIIALELLSATQANKIKVPEEIKITGFDGIAEGQRIYPNLTTVSQSSVKKGELAVQILLNGSKQALVIEHELIVGHTT